MHLTTHIYNAPHWHLGVELPGGRGTWNGIFYPERGDRPRGFDELTFYAERFNTVEINSTFYGQPRDSASLGWVKRTPPASSLPSSYIRSSRTRRWPPTRLPCGPPTWTPSRRGIEPLATAEPAGTTAGAVSGELQEHPGNTRIPGWLLTTFADYDVAVELRHRSWSDAATSHLRSPARARRRLDTNRRAEVPFFNAAGLDAEHEGFLLHAASRPKRRAMVGARERGGSLQLPVFGGGAEADRRRRCKTAVRS